MVIPNKRYRNIFSIITLIVLASVVSLSGCTSPSPLEDIFQNPGDTASTKFVAPRTMFIEGPQNGQTISTESVTFRWQGNATVIQFSFKKDTDNWSAWSGYTSSFLEYLDEGAHTFTVKSKHWNITTEESNPPVISFIVDVYKGPSAMFSPRRKYVNAGDVFTYDVRAEEVNMLYLARLTLRYNPALVVIDTIQPGSMMQGNGGSALLLSTIDNTAGTALVDLASVGRKPKGVSGSGVLAVLNCRAVAAGTVDFTFSRTECEYRDTTIAIITIRDLVGGRVVVR